MSLTKATYSMIEGAAANVLDFGADPTGIANITTAIQAAITSLGANGGTVWLPAGYE
jgi:polygalacturonase